MKNKHLLRKFMTENNIDFDVPFIVKNGNNAIKYKITEEEGTYGTVPKIRFYRNEWKEADLSWLMLIMFCEGYKIIKPIWKPKDNEKFWYISKRGNIFSRSYDPGDPSDIALFLTGNCFKDKKEAEENKEKVFQTLNRDEPFIDLNKE